VYCRAARYVVERLRERITELEETNDDLRLELRLAKMQADCLLDDKKLSEFLERRRAERREVTGE
jgi:hypothetical protein